MTGHAVPSAAVTVGGSDRCFIRHKRHRLVIHRPRRPLEAALNNGRELFTSWLNSFSSSSSSHGSQCSCRRCCAPEWRTDRTRRSPTSVANSLACSTPPRRREVVSGQWDDRWPSRRSPDRLQVDAPASRRFARVSPAMPLRRNSQLPGMSRSSIPSADRSTSSTHPASGPTAAMVAISVVRSTGAARTAVHRTCRTGTPTIASATSPVLAVESTARSTSSVSSPTAVGVLAIPPTAFDVTAMQPGPSVARRNATAPMGSVGLAWTATEPVRSASRRSSAG